MVGLRLAEGISGEEIRSFCNPACWERLYQTLQPHVRNGWVVMEGDTWARLQRLRLTDPEGFLFSNVVLTDCFSLLSEMGSFAETVES
jgi:oxygen-independent coproporphyrinogen-3 oxidase